MVSEDAAVTFKRHFLSWAFPAVAVIGSVHVSWLPKQITHKDVDACYRVLRPGMVFLSRIKWTMSNLMIPGFWTHAAIVVTPECLVESVVNPGVHTSALYNFMLTKDYVCVLRPKFANEVEMLAAADWASRQIGKPYDTEMASSLKAFYCSELVCESYRQTMRDRCPFVPRLRYGEPTCVPQDFWDAKDKWEIVWRSPSCQEEKLTA